MTDQTTNLEKKIVCDGEGCRNNADECYCTACIAEMQQESYDEGHTDGLKEGRTETNDKTKP